MCLTLSASNARSTADSIDAALVLQNAGFNTAELIAAGYDIDALGIFAHFGGSVLLVLKAVGGSHIGLDRINDFEPQGDGVPDLVANVNCLAFNEELRELLGQPSAADLVETTVSRHRHEGVAYVTSYGINVGALARHIEAGLDVEAFLVAMENDLNADDFNVRVTGPDCGAFNELLAHSVEFTADTDAYAVVHPADRAAVNRVLPEDAVV